MSVNDPRKYKNQYNEKNAGAWRPTVARVEGAWPHILFVPVHCILLGFSYLTLCPLILSLGPCILFYFLGVPPPRHHTGIMNEIFLVYHEIPWYTIFFNLWWVQMFLSNWIKWLADIEWQWPDWCKVCPLINTFQAGELSQLIHALITPQKYVRSYPHLHWVSSHEIPMNLPTFVACRTGHCPHSRDDPHHDSGSRCIRRSKRTRRPLWMCIPGIARQVTSDLPLFSGWWVGICFYFSIYWEW